MLESISPVDGVMDHLRKPIYNRAYALIVSSAITAVLGLGFWTLAAHLYGAGDLGVNAAVISAMMFLSYLAQLSLAGALTRFIPTAGRSTRRLVLASYGVAVLITAVVATVFVIGAGLWAPQLHPLVANPMAGAWFVAAAMAWSLFALQDAVLTGLRRTMWVPIENTIFAVIKIVALVALAGSLTGSGIYVSWTVPAALSVVPINFMIFRWFLPNPASPFGAGVPVILTDNFEAATINPAWSVVDQEGDGTAAISTTSAHTGLCAGKFSVSAAVTSRAYITKSLGSSKTDVWASGWFDVAQEGVALSNVPYLRFFDGATRIVDVYRQNSSGDVWLRTAGTSGWVYASLLPAVALNSWHQVAVHVIPSGAASTVQVWIDGVSVLASTTIDLHATVQLTTVQLGNELLSQQMVEYFDDVVVGGN